MVILYLSHCMKADIFDKIKQIHAGRIWRLGIQSGWTGKADCPQIAQNQRAERADPRKILWALGWEQRLLGADLSEVSSQSACPSCFRYARYIRSLLRASWYWTIKYRTTAEYGRTLTDFWDSAMSISLKWFASLFRILLWRYEVPNPC